MEIMYILKMEFCFNCGRDFFFIEAIFKVILFIKYLLFIDLKIFVKYLLCVWYG